MLDSVAAYLRVLSEQLPLRGNRVPFAFLLTAGNTGVENGCGHASPRFASLLRFCLLQRAADALRALALRSAAVMRSARFWPPMRPCFAKNWRMSSGNFTTAILSVAPT